MHSREFRRMARGNLQNRWGQAAIIMLVYALCIFGISFVLAFIPLIGQIADFIISPVLTFGLLKQWIKFKNNEDVGYVDFFGLGFENFVMVWKIILRVALKLLKPIALILIGWILGSAGPIIGFGGGNGIIAGILTVIGSILTIVGYIWCVPISYKYMCATNELAYDSNRSSKEIVEQSGKYMTGNRFRMFVLQFSFIGWAILAAFTCGIGCLWLIPYVQISTILFYESISGRLNAYESVDQPINATVISGDDPIH